jgi:hypothetical protein
MESPVALEIDRHSVLLGWPSVTGALAYELQMKHSISNSTENQTEDCKENDCDAMNEWKSLSSTIQGTNIRKKNLVDGKLHRLYILCTQS